MQTASPYCFQNQSPGDSTAHGPNFQDPYLSAPSDPEEDAFKSGAIRITPLSGQSSNHHSTPDAISSPSDLMSSGSVRGIDDTVISSDNPSYMGSGQEFLSPTENVFSDLSNNTSPNDTDLLGGLGVDLDSGLRNWQQGLAPPAFTGDNPNGGLSGQKRRQSSQLLSPDMTHNPSPRSDGTPLNMFTTVSEAQLALHNALGSPQHQHIKPPHISVGSDGLNVQEPDSTRARSPIVKVESYSRGDSPERDYYPSGRRPSQSSSHLSPGGANESSSESEDEESSSEITPINRAPDGSWVPNATTGSAGVDPASRADVYVPSPNELELWRELQDKNADIQNWSASVSAANSEAGDETAAIRGRDERRRNRPRAKSAGDPSLYQDYFNHKLRLNDSAIPGPGVLLYESSNGDFSEPESWSESPPASVSQAGYEETVPENVPLPVRQSTDDSDPLPSQFIRVRPWQDPAQDPSPQTTRLQPQSSNAAMVEFQRRARDIDTASRSATWGTRNLTEAFENMSFDDEKKRRNSLRKFLPTKAATNLKRHLSQISLNQPHGDDLPKEEGTNGPERKDSFPNSRKLSLGRSHQRSPSLSNAVLAITGQMAAVGGRGSINAASPPGGTMPRSAPRKIRQRSRSELPRPATPSLMDLMTSQGGPPVPNIGNSMAHSNGAKMKRLDSGNDAGEDEDEDEDITDDKGIVMEFPMTHLPVPTLEGFRGQVAQVNPRLGPALVERFANEQLRRYKTLVETKANHNCVVSKHQCMSGKYCFAQGGDAMLAPVKTGAQKADAMHTQFHIPEKDDAEVADDAECLSEGAVTAALFPIGVPLPPVKRLPAEFECHICFKVRKFQKPSDWTKHVLEDVQPFTCTFAECTEPKSFKRKADWVRHENERHRHLEWWTCTIPECHHTCYRKDNFVQHLVREHKMPDPKVKKTKAKGQKAGANGNSLAPEVQSEESRREREVEKLWELVESCRHDTDRSPNEEPCRFCGNICATWKKLTAHLAKHMEQIAMPVLSLVKERDFSLHTDAGLVGNANTGSVARSREAPYLAPYQGETANGSAMQLNAVQGQYNDLEKSAAPFDSTYPPLITVEDGVMSAEPESMDNCNDMSQQPSFLGSGNHQFTPMHQNSVTYPPPFNAVPRPRVATQEMGLLQDPYQLTLSPPEMAPTYDPHGQLYLSPTAENSYPPVQTMPYDPSGTEFASNGASYM